MIQIVKTNEKAELKNREELTSDSTKVDFTKVYQSEANRFKLSVAIAKRARQIQDGAKALVGNGDEEVAPVLIALQELAKEKFSVSVKETRDEHKEMLAEMESLIENDLIEEEPVVEKEKKKSKK